ncbi:cyanocobalamin reductase / alkylcobalamin dealkylase-like [Amphiura filiformis]|uniref:cyanocobalamin reductase / alkylcobalamin dealkylase-like n=1 Tax=Amphiura filiformis TaxID=82378 RepID=UPI003B2262CC
MKWERRAYNISVKMADSVETCRCVEPGIVSELQGSLSGFFSQYGFECYPFKVSWYNKKVDSSYHLAYHDDTLAFCIVSTPQMFDKAFKPFIANITKIGIRDPIDECVASYFKQAKESLPACDPSHEIDTIYDYELHPNKKPKLLVQTAGHVSGSAYYYQRCDIQEDPWPKEKRIFGISMHPKYGGWFAFRGALIFKKLQCPTLPESEPARILTTDAEIIDLLEKLNNNWQDNAYRDVIPPIDRYSEEQQVYFNTAPKDRAKLLGLEKDSEGKLQLAESRDMGQ